MMVAFYIFCLLGCFGLIMAAFTDMWIWGFGACGYFYVSLIHYLEYKFKELSK